MPSMLVGPSTRALFDGEAPPMHYKVVCILLYFYCIVYTV